MLRNATLPKMLIKLLGSSPTFFSSVSGVLGLIVINQGVKTHTSSWRSVVTERIASTPMGSFLRTLGWITYSSISRTDPFSVVPVSQSI